MMDVPNILSHPISNTLQLTILPLLLGQPWEWLFDDHNGLSRTNRLLRPLRPLLYGFGHLGLTMLVVILFKGLNEHIEKVVTNSGLDWMAVTAIVACVLALAITPVVMFINSYIIPKIEIKRHPSKIFSINGNR